MFLSLFTVFKFLDATPASRNVAEGEKLLNAKHLLICGIKEKTSTFIKILALCLQTSSLNSFPHEIVGSFMLTGNGDIEITSMVCSCKAGLGEKCKHIAAVLLHCARCNLLEMEQLSSTDIQCIWNKRKGASLFNYTPQPISSFKCINYKKLSPLPDDQQSKFRDLMIKLLPNSALALHKKRFKEGNAAKVISINPEEILFRSLFNLARESESMHWLSFFPIYPMRRCCQEFYTLYIKCENSLDLCLHTKSNSKKWQDERRFRITGSRCYSLYTYKGQDWEIKSGKYFWPKTFSTVYTKHGLKYENEARDTYRRNLGRTVLELGLVVCEINPFLAYSPDGVVMENGVPSKLLEIKCPFEGLQHTAGTFVLSCSYLKIENDRVVLNKKHQYYGQVQLGMAILNLKQCDFIVYAPFDKSFINIIVDRDSSFLSQFLSTLKMNYFNNMLHNICILQNNI